MKQQPTPGIWPGELLDKGAWWFIIYGIAAHQVLLFLHYLLESAQIHVL